MTKELREDLIEFVKSLDPIREDGFRQFVDGAMVHGPPPTDEMVRAAEHIHKAGFLDGVAAALHEMEIRGVVEFVRKEAL